MTEIYDVCVIGAGLLGTFAARALRERGASVCVLEKASDVGTGISKANAAIVYSGYDVPPDTLKSRLCIPGCENMPSLCETLGVRYRRCGSILVCFGENGERSVREKYEQGLKNSVPGLTLLTGDEVLALEPNLRRDVRMGLYAPNAGTLEPWDLCIAAYENGKANGAEFFLNTEVTSVSFGGGIYIMSTSHGEIRAKSVINCAGLNAAKVHDMLLTPKVGIRTSVSDLCVFAPESDRYVNHIIFSETEDGAKGVTLIPTVDGKLMAESPVKEKTHGNSPVSSQAGQRALLSMCRELVPELESVPVLRYFAAVRPNPYDVSDRKHSIGSFTVLKEDGFFSLIGIKTPGMTCAEGLGRYVSDSAADFLGISGCNEEFSPHRAAPVRLSEMTESERAETVKKDPLYGRIICRCGGISEGEVLDAIHAGASDIDGVKRRCGTSLGECQGSFCTARIAKLISRELNIPIKEVLLRHD